MCDICCVKELAEPRGSSSFRVPPRPRGTRSPGSGLLGWSSRGCKGPAGPVSEPSGRGPCGPPARKFQHGYAASSKCDFCDHPQGAFGHQFYECEGLWAVREVPGASAAMPDSCIEHRNWLKEQAYGIPPDFDTPEL
eukprot:2891631-Pyramimonas_sp.AAC.1